MELLKWMGWMGVLMMVVEGMSLSGVKGRGSWSSDKEPRNWRNGSEIQLRSKRFLPLVISGALVASAWIGGTFAFLAAIGDPHLVPKEKPPEPIPRERGGPFEEFFGGYASETCPGLELVLENHYQDTDFSKLDPEEKACRNESGKGYPAGCSFCVADQHICIDRTPQAYHTGRCPFGSEGGMESCGRGIKFGGYTTMSHPQHGPLHDLMLSCSGSSEPSLQYCNSVEKIEYQHPMYGLIKTFAMRKGHICNHYCVGHVELAYISDRFGWMFNSSCPSGELQPGCLGLEDKASEYPSVIGIGDNSWCFKVPEPIIYNEKSEYVIKNRSDGGPSLFKIQTKRKCGSITDCPVGYCLKTRNKETTCGTTEDFDLWASDSRDGICYYQTADGSSLRLSENEWCCRNSDGCSETVGKCTQTAACQANYCVGFRNGDQRSTRCPSEKESQWKDCLDLKFGETKRIEEQDAFCCIIDDRGSHCDYDLRACGSDLSCKARFCLGERTEGGRFRTICPDDRKIAGHEVCQDLPESSEYHFSPHRTCCKKVECRVLACGDDASCRKAFCVRTKNFLGTASHTICPNDYLEQSLWYDCSSLLPGEILVVGEHTCCKMRHCGPPITEKHPSSGAATTESTAKSETTSPRSRVKIKKQGPVRWLLTFWIILTGITCFVIFGGGGLALYHVRKRSKRKASPQKKTRVGKAALKTRKSQKRSSKVNDRKSLQAQSKKAPTRKTVSGVNIPSKETPKKKKDSDPEVATTPETRHVLSPKSCPPVSPGSTIPESRTESSSRKKPITKSTSTPERSDDESTKPVIG